MQQYLSRLEALLPEKRYQHSLRVAEEAKGLARHYGASEEKAYLAGILHDAAKYLNPELLFQNFEFQCSDELKAVYEEYPAVWHSYVGPIFVEQVFGISSSTIQSAIRWHTTGGAEMGLMDEILFVSDFIEPGRPFPEVTSIRDLAYQNLQKAVLALSGISIFSLLARGLKIHPNTMLCYNHYLITHGPVPMRPILGMRQA